MKRHPSLAHLSREHHPALILARLLQKDAPAYKGLPTDIDGKVTYALKFYKEQLLSHFEEEEKVLKLVTGTNEELDLLVQTIFREHEQLHESFTLISNHQDVAGYIDKLGRALENHIRKEERELFPLIQQSCSEGVMIEIDKSLSSANN